MTIPETEDIAQLIDQEEKRQTSKLGLIPSENHISPAVSQVLSSCLSSKYSEGYPHRRYYEGNQIVDQIELIAQDRVKKLFNEIMPAARRKKTKSKLLNSTVTHVNVQPYSGSPANSAIEFALLEPGDTLMGLSLANGGHLTHGHPRVTFSGKFYKSVQFGLNNQAKIDFNQVRDMAKKAKPKLLMIGTTAYPFELDYEKFRQIADEVGAWLVADISHITGLVIAGLQPDPVPYADVIMSTTHKTFRGPRGAMILLTERGMARDAKLSTKIDSAIIPGLQGGPHNATTAGIAIAAAEAARPEFAAYAHRIMENAQALAQNLIKEKLNLVGGGTQNHLLLLDLTQFGPGLGAQVAFALDQAGIYANRNTVPHEPMSPFYPSGLRLGTPLITTRGMQAKHMAQIAAWIGRVVRQATAQPLPTDSETRKTFLTEFRSQAQTDPVYAEIAQEVKTFATKFPLFSWSPLD